MFYSFSRHMEELAADPKTIGLVIQYYNAFGHDVADDLENQPFYKDYVGCFSPVGPRLRVPKGAEDAYDWDLVCQFVAASFSTRAKLEHNPDNRSQIQMAISVEQDCEETTRYLHTLSFDSVKSTFEIYVMEQMQLSFNRSEKGVRLMRIHRQRDWQLRRRCVNYQ